MRTVRMFTTYANDSGVSATPGQTIALAAGVAENLVDKGYAEYADDGGKDPRRGRRRAPAKPKTEGQGDGA